MAAAASSPSGLTSAAFVPFELKARTKYNHNTDQFIFALKDATVSPSLPVSSCIMTRFTNAEGKEIIRPYTPINQHQVGVLNLLIKVYPSGNMSKHIHGLKVGESLEIKGPMPKLKYEANKYKNIALVAGGTGQLRDKNNSVMFEASNVLNGMRLVCLFVTFLSGITPMLQIINEIFFNPSDKTHVTLIFANATSKDVLLREKIDGYSKSHPQQFKVVYIIDKAEDGVDWVQETGHINKAILEKYLPKPAAENFIYTCGPPGFMNLISGDKQPDKTQGPLIGLLADLGYTSANVYKQ